MEEEVLQGGVANAGAVTRVGPHVLRPSNAESASIHRYLTWLRDAGFDGASVPVGIDGDGRERLVFIEGDVAVPPYPSWVQTDEALASAAVLLRRCHQAARSFDPSTATWNTEMADPEGGPIVCHNDACLENVVFRDGVAVALIDWDFAAPGRPEYDVAQLARYAVPIEDDLSAARLGWVPVAPRRRPGRLRLVADAYGLDAAGRTRLLSILDDLVARGGEFVLARVEAGDANFIAMWDQVGGMERFDRRRRWWADARPTFVDALR
jgi:hypothetical protein